MDKDAADRISACPYHVSGNNRGSLDFSRSPDLFIPASHIYSEADFREITTDGNHIALAMTDDHFIVGFIITALRTKSNMVTGTLIAYVDDMFVHPSYRGQKIATTLFHKMERRAKKLGATRIDLMVWEFNESAQKLYRSLGMIPQRYILEKLL